MGIRLLAVAALSFASVPVGAAEEQEDRTLLDPALGGVLRNTEIKKTKRRGDLRIQFRKPLALSRLRGIEQFDLNVAVYKFKDASESCKMTFYSRFERPPTQRPFRRSRKLMLTTDGTARKLGPGELETVVEPDWLDIKIVYWLTSENCDAVLRAQEVEGELGDTRFIFGGAIKRGLMAIDSAIRAERDPKRREALGR